MDMHMDMYIYVYKSINTLGLGPPRAFGNWLPWVRGLCRSWPGTDSWNTAFAT